MDKNGTRSFASSAIFVYPIGCLHITSHFTFGKSHVACSVHFDVIAHNALFRIFQLAALSPRFLCRPTAFFFDLLEPWDVRALSIRKTADLPLQVWVGTFPRFMAIGFYFLLSTFTEIASTILFLSIHNHLTPKKWFDTRLQHDFPVDPLISPFHFHFLRAYAKIVL